MMVLIIIAGLGFWGYARLGTDFNSHQISPEIEVSGRSVITSVISAAERDWLGTFESYLKGVNIKGTITFHNPSPVPIYLPDMEHNVFIEGKECENPIRIGSLWLGPRATRTKSFDALVITKDLPDLAVAALARGGTLNIKTETKTSLGVFSVTYTSFKLASVTGSEIDGGN